LIDPPQRRLALLVAGCFFMEILDGTMVTTSAPRIAADLGVSYTAIGLVVTAYLVTLAVLIPLSGWMVTRFGVRPIFLSAITVFTLASLLCASSVDLSELVAMRVLQGVGGAMMVPVGRLAVLGPAAKADIMRLVSYIVWPGLMAPVVAPLAGGIITTYAGWRWLFVINVPLGVVAFIAARRLVPVSETSEPPPLDVLGVGLTCVGLGALTGTAALASTPAPRWGLVALVGGIAVLALAMTVRHLRRTPFPLIDLATLRIATYRSALSTGFLFYMAIASVPFLLPLLFENVFGWSAIKAGAVVLFLFAGNIGIKPAVATMINRFGFRPVLVGTGAALAATMIGLGVVTGSTPLVLIAGVAMLSGVFRSIGGTSYNTLIYSDVPADQMAHANSLSATSTQLSAGLGVAAATVALRIGVAVGPALPGPVSLSDRYTVAFVLLAALPALAAFGAARLPTDAGDAVRTPG
jgi:EmrB/QacA subfamily drug resistance transporter